MAGLVGGSIVLAQDSNQSTNRSFGQVAGVTAQQNVADDLIAALAKNLGIDETKLRDAIKKTGTEYVDKLVADGKIDQAMADKIKNAIQTGDISGLGMGRGLFGFGAGPGGHMGKGGMDGIPFLGPLKQGTADVAGFLGITQDQLHTELEGGKSLADVASAHGKSRDDLKKFLGSEVDKALADAVGKGQLTQARADELKKLYTDNVDKLIDAKHDGLNGPAGRGGFGPFGMPGRGRAPANPSGNGTGTN